MRNLKYIIIGAVFGGAFGAKIGGYLFSNLQFRGNYGLIENGFIYGAIAGMLIAFIFILAFAIAPFKGHNQRSNIKQMTIGGSRNQLSSVDK